MAFDLSKFDKFNQYIRLGTAGPLRPVFKKWGVRYLGWTRRMFLEKSRGGSADGVTWPPLKQISYRRATGSRLRGVSGKAASRLKAKRERGRVAILRDTGTLLKALTPGDPGNKFDFVRHGVSVGFGGPTKHPSGGKATIRDIAVFHDQGEGKLPRRQILHKPDAAMVQFMLRTLREGIQGIGRTL